MINFAPGRGTRKHSAMFYNHEWVSGQTDPHVETPVCIWKEMFWTITESTVQYVSIQQIKAFAPAKFYGLKACNWFISDADRDEIGFFAM